MSGTDHSKTAPAANGAPEHVDDEHAENRTNDDEGGKNNELEQMEEEMMKGVKRREAGKTNEGTVPKEKDPLQSKKVAKPSVKRPAAAMDTPEFSARAYKVAKNIDMKDIFSRLPSRIKEPGMHRGKIVGWVYGHGRHRAELEGAPDEVCKEVGSIMSAKAGKICGGKP